MEHAGLQAFINYLETERGFSGHTVKAYILDLDQFAAYLQAGPSAFDDSTTKKVSLATTKHLAKATRNDIRAFLGHALLEPPPASSPQFVPHTNSTSAQIPSKKTPQSP